MTQPSAPDAAVPRRRQARGDRTRGALVDAALDLFGERGLDAVGVDEITTAAQVAKGTFYVHFQRKADVLLERAAQLVDDVRTGPPSGDVRADLGAMAADLARVLSGLPRPVTGRMTREIVGNPVDWLRVLGARPTLRAVIRPILEEGVDRGVIRSDLSPARMAQALTVLWLDTVVGWAERDVERDLAAELEQVTGLFCDGAVTGASPAGGRT